MGPSIDMEKVIKGLECCKESANCSDCPYPCYSGYAENWPNQLLTDALALLKKQEAVKPKKIKGYYPPMYTLYEYECEKCETPILNQQPFCMGCGQKVKWE